MKNVIISILILFVSVGVSYANKYEKAMASAIDKLNTSNSLDEYLSVVAAFERIGTAEKNEWLPYYYASLGYIQTSHATEDGEEKDAYLDKAQLSIDQSAKLSPGNDEIVTLQGYIYMMKVVIDPMTRGPEYGGKAMQEFGTAIGMNENNPRALLLYGRMQMGSDQFMGNDISESCKIINKANQMLVQQISDKSLMPKWGKEMAEVFVQECDLSPK
jgi:hypothetical protein